MSGQMVKTANPRQPLVSARSQLCMSQRKQQTLSGATSYEDTHLQKPGKRSQWVAGLLRDVLYPDVVVLLVLSVNVDDVVLVCTYAFHAFTDYCLQSLQNLSNFKQHFIALELVDF